MSENRGVIRHLPNILTLLNLCCGFVALYFIALGEWFTVCWLIGIAGLADLLDGLVARALKVSSPIGAQLDSLADMISFGVVPGMVLFMLIIQTPTNPGELNDLDTTFKWFKALPCILFPMCAALRLARFNVDDDSAGDFIGLSTPAATAVVIGYIIFGPWVLQDHIAEIALAFGLGYLMVSNISMFSLKFKGMGWKGNEIRYIFILLFVVLLFAMPKAAILITMLLYIVVNTILHYYRKITT